MRETYSEELHIILQNLLHDTREGVTGCELGDAMDCIQELNEKFGEPTLSTFIRESVKGEGKDITINVNVNNECGCCECKSSTQHTNEDRDEREFRYCSSSCG